MKNTKPIRSIAFATLLVAGAGGALAEEEAMSEAEARAIAGTVTENCLRPEEPDVPDGASVSEAQLLSTQSEVQAYVSAAQAFLGCIERKEAGYGDDITEDQKAVIVAIHNATVRAMQAKADEFNAAVRAYNGQDER